MRSTAREVKSSDARSRAAHLNGTVPLKPIGVEEPTGQPPRGQTPHAEEPDHLDDAWTNEHGRTTPAQSPRRTPSRATGWNWQRYVVRQVLALGGNPPLAVVLPDGDEVRASTEPPIAWIHVRDRGVLRRVFCNPFYQFGEAYTDGGLQVEGDLVEVLTAIEHADGSKDVVLAVDVAPVVLDKLNAVLQPLAEGALAGVLDLLVRDVIGPDGYAILPRHVQGQAAPAATGFDHGFARPQPELAADVVELGRLRGFQAGVGRGEIGACVGQRVVQPEFVKVIADVVVMVDVFARSRQRMTTRPPRDP